MKRLRGYWVGGSYMGLGILACGCASTTKAREEYQPYAYLHAPAPTLAQTGDEHFRTVKSSVRRDTLGLMEDLDLFFMTDRPSRLNRWHDR